MRVMYHLFMIILPSKKYDVYYCTVVMRLVVFGGVIMNKVLAKKVCISMSILLVGGTVVVLGTNSKIVSKAASSVVKTSGSVVTITEYNANNKTEKVGRGYNALSGDYTKMQGINDNNFIFSKRSSDSSKDKVIEDTKVSVDTGYSNGKSYIVSGKNSNEFLNSLKCEIDSQTNASLSGDLSPLSMKMFLNVNSKFESSVTSGKVSEYIKAIKEPIVASVSWNLKESQYFDYLDDDFINDLLNMEPEKLFKKYGTHFFRSYLLGGRLEINAVVTSDTNEQLTTVSSNFKSSIKADGKVDNNDISVSDDVSSSINITDKDTLAASDIKTDAQYYGGKEADFDAYADLLANRALGKNDKNGTNNISCSTIYKDWVSSVEEEPTLIDIYDENSLYPIWDLLLKFPEDYEVMTKDELVARRDALEETFNKLKEEYDNDIKNQVNKIQNKDTKSNIGTTLTGVKASSSYDYKATLDDSVASVHNGYKLGEIYITNSHRNDDDTVSLTDNKFKVVYNMTQDKTNLPTGDLEGVYKHSLISDVIPTLNINGYGDIFKYQSLRKGASYVQIKYKNSITPEPVKKVNIFKSINKGQSVVLFESDAADVYNNGGVESIKVLVLYETKIVYDRNLNKPIKYCKWLDEGTVEFK